MSADTPRNAHAAQQTRPRRIDQSCVPSTRHDWGRHHSPRNLAMALTVEAGELLEPPLAADDGPQPPVASRSPRVADEAADVLICLLNFCDRAGVDLHAAFERASRSRRSTRSISPAVGWRSPRSCRRLTGCGRRNGGVEAFARRSGNRVACTWDRLQPRPSQRAQGDGSLRERGNTRSPAVPRPDRWGGRGWRAFR